MNTFFSFRSTCIVPGPPETLKAIPSSVDSVVVAWKPPKAPNGQIALYTVHVESTPIKDVS